MQNPVRLWLIQLDFNGILFPTGNILVKVKGRTTKVEYIIQITRVSVNRDAVISFRHSIFP